MRVLITGAGGLLATALAPRFEHHFALRHAALDITDRQAVGEVMTRLQPDLVVNTAVIGVDACQRDPELAAAVNVEGPRFLAQAVHQAGAAMVHFSSNYVFEGLPVSREPYRVDDEPHPINIYGKTKLLGERAVAESCPRSFVIRTSWVYGPGKESFLGTVAGKLGRGERVQAIGDAWASTTWVHDLADRVMQIVAAGRYGLHHVANEGVCSHETFARLAADLAGVPAALADRLIEVISEADLRREAPRPLWTPMLCAPPLRRWEEALAASLSGGPR